MCSKDAAVNRLSLLVLAVVGCLGHESLLAQSSPPGLAAPNIDLIRSAPDQQSLAG